MIWLVLLACTSDQPCEGALCDQGGDDTATGTDDSTADDTGSVPECHDGDEVLIESPKTDPDVVHYHWSAEPRFTENGGVIPDEDAPAIVMSCPACVEGSTQYQIQVDFSDAKDRGLGYALTSIEQVCE